VIEVHGEVGIAVVLEVVLEDAFVFAVLGGSVGPMPSWTRVTPRRKRRSLVSGKRPPWRIQRVRKMLRRGIQ